MHVSLRHMIFVMQAVEIAVEVARPPPMHPSYLFPLESQAPEVESEEDEADREAQLMANLLSPEELPVHYSRELITPHPLLPATSAEEPLPAVHPEASRGPPQGACSCF